MALWKTINSSEMKSPKSIRQSKIYQNFPTMFQNGKNRKASVYGADFESAIAATGFGKFNLLLMIIAIPCGWAIIFDSTVISYVLPSVYCDLDLNLQQRGMLNGITYFGMVASAFLWGFLSDTFGRRKLLITGFGLDAVFVILAGLSQTYETLLAAKFMTGFIINGPFATLTTVLSEFHGKRYRAKILLLLGIIYAAANLALPLMAWGILHKDWHWILIKGKFELHPWNFYILVSSIPSILSSISHYFLPESPKFLMTAGNNDLALETFKKVYSLNSGKDKQTFPIKSLIEENDYGTGNTNKSLLRVLKEGLAHMKPLFRKENCSNLILVCVVQTGILTAVNTLRLWLPQIYTTINDFQTSYPNVTNASLCTMLSTATTNYDVNIIDCSTNNTKALVYINVLIVNTVNMVGYIIAGLVINHISKKIILIVLGSIASVTGFCIHFANNVAITTTLSSLNNVALGISGNIVLVIVVELFPTSLRTSTVSIVMMMGRAGAMIGNIIFPVLLELGCWEPFLFISLSVLISTVTTTFLPKTDMKSLE